MSKKKTQPRKRTPKPASLIEAVPPLAAAIATFVDPGRRELPPEFRRAWAAAPGILKQFTNNQDSGEPCHTYVTERAKAAIDESRKSTEHWNKKLAQAVELLEDSDSDLLEAVRYAYSEPAFSLGLALGLYLTTTGGGVR